MSEPNLDISEDWQKAESLAHRAKELVSKGRLEEALKSWNEAIRIARRGETSANQQSSVDSSSVLWEIAEEMALAGEAKKAQEIATSIRNNHKRQQAQQSVTEIMKGEKGSFHKIRSNLSI